MQARLENWARWLTEGSHAGLGYPRQSAFTRQLRVSASTDNARIPVDDVEARQTHDAIEALRTGHGHLYLVVHCRLVGDPRVPQRVRRPLAVKETGAAMCIADATVYAHMARARAMLSAYLKRASGSFTH
jgi:hypothetical protein